MDPDVSKPSSPINPISPTQTDAARHKWPDVWRVAERLQGAQYRHVDLDTLASEVGQSRSTLTRRFPRRQKTVPTLTDCFWPQRARY